MAKNVILHCGKRIPTEQVYSLLDYPSIGDETVIFACQCKICGHLAIAYFTKPFLKSDSTELFQASKTNKSHFISLIRTGEARQITKLLDDLREARAQVIASDYTLTISKPVEQSIQYIQKVCRLENCDFKGNKSLSRHKEAKK